MLTIEEKSELFYIYYEKWIRIYKEGAIRNVTMRKYEITLLWLKKLVPELKLSQLNRISYQQLLNDYAEFHERQTTMDFHHQIKAAILDAVDEGFIDRDPTRKAIIKGRSPRIKKIKYLNQFELHTLLVNLKLTSEINWDWLILIIAKTGMRFSEALALTPKDFDFSEIAQRVAEKLLKKYNGKLPSRALQEKIIQNLMNKGFSYADAKSAFDDLDSQVDQETTQELIFKELDKQYAKYARKYEGYELKQRLTQVLARKGYDFSDIASALREYL